ncbi:cysteine desulfurase [Brevibacterium sp. 91QC2O2]|uniref:cysteine desulfurase family protein n=1 Tax=Brevibacterium sp. 91QC2O2 TaxID=2968458 RepID=UPI00211B8FE1|nr:cysteine desulfurase family protein [Brevibacterium sp. 91QC2O2]MCQ9369576.1 cysteine desulfurase [Brevibacterium sp. 91QC2O2]
MNSEPETTEPETTAARQSTQPAEPTTPTGPVNLDCAATQAVRPEVLSAIWPLLSEQFGNPASHHEAGEQAARALDWARSLAAETLGTRPGRIVFTSGGTESNSLALHGTLLARHRGGHVLVSAIEHPSVLQTAQQLQRWHGAEVETVPVGMNGIVDPAEVAALLRPDTCLVAVMAVNNEVGTIQPIQEIAELVHGAGARLHVDAVQAGSWLDLRPLERVADTLSVSGHKLGGIKGAGLLALGRGVVLEPFMDGGGQEGGIRSGTVNVPGCVSTALALHLAQQEALAYQTGEELPCGREPGRRLAQAVLTGLGDLGVAARLSGDPESRVPGTVSFVFPGLHAEAVLLELGRHGVLASSGSACAAGSTEPSAVLTALGWDPVEALGALRLSFSPHTPAAVLDYAARAVIESVAAVADLGR